MSNSKERIAIRENEVSNSRERIAIRENELSNSTERITNLWERITIPWERIAQFDITIYLWLFKKNPHVPSGLSYKAFIIANHVESISCDRYSYAVSYDIFKSVRITTVKRWNNLIRVFYLSNTYPWQL